MPKKKFPTKIFSCSSETHAQFFWRGGDFGVFGPPYVPFPARQHHCLQAALVHKTCYQPILVTLLYTICNTIWEVSFATYTWTQKIVNYQNAILHILLCLVLGIFYKLTCRLCMVVVWNQPKNIPISFTTPEYFTHRHNSWPQSSTSYVPQ